MKAAEFLALQAKQMREDELAAEIYRLSKTLGLKRYHTWNSQNSASGWMDEVLGGPGGVLFRELKREGKNPTRAQQGWIDLFAANGMDVGVWRPADWFSGRIRNEMQAIARRDTNRAAP